MKEDGDGVLKQLDHAGQGDKGASGLPHLSCQCYDTCGICPDTLRKKEKCCRMKTKKFAFPLRKNNVNVK